MKKTLLWLLTLTLLVTLLCAAVPAGASELKSNRPAAVSTDAGKERESKEIGKWTLDPVTIDPSKFTSEIGTVISAADINLPQRLKSIAFGQSTYTVVKPAAGRYALLEIQATCYDQYGAVMNDSLLTYTYSWRKQMSGVTVKSMNGGTLTLVVSPNAAAGTYEIGFDVYQNSDRKNHVYGKVKLCITGSK